MTAAEEKIKRRELRKALGTFVTGVTVATTIDAEGRPRGLTANSFTSVSLDPPLVLVCVAGSASSHSAFHGCKRFAVNVLSETQQEASMLFASKAPDKFQRTAWRPGQGGTPILNEALGWFDCLTHDRVEAGDHTILIGRIEDFGHGPERPLGYFQGGYVSFGLQEAALTQARGQSAALGCIADDGERILLCRRRASGGWTVPLVGHSGSGGADKAALARFLASIEVELDLSFLYSVFEVPDWKSLCIVYRGRARDRLDPKDNAEVEARLFAPGEIPWQDPHLQPFRGMLKRYLHERASARFGVYVDGSGEGGHVAMLDGPPEAWSSYRKAKQFT